MLPHLDAIDCDTAPISGEKPRQDLLERTFPLAGRSQEAEYLPPVHRKAHILNDDKPVVKIKNEVPLCCGTPFDGGSGIANNETVPVGAIIFIERSDANFVTIPDTNEIVQRLYKSTVKFVNKSDGMSLLSNLDNLIRHTKFYVLHCNTDECAVDVAYNNIIKNCK